jgi:alginate O-acetyltransferase complex protein AlgI
MIFTTWPFFCFMTIVFVGYWWVVPARWRRPFLLVMSLAYFTYNYPPFTLLLGGLSLAVYLLGLLIFALQAKDAATRAKAALIGGLILCAGTLAFFKYSKLAVGVWNSFAGFAEVGAKLPLPKLLVPLGISFFTFEFIHYLTDLYHGRVKRVSLLDFSLFAFFFPSLVSGPIKRFQIFQEQTEGMGGFHSSYAADGLRRIVLGIAKKLILADTAGLLTTVFTHPGGASRLALWLAMYAYAVKIYYDFSGYTDIAIGCGQLLGYRLPENFNKPYRQPNISKFWNNWHMSLSSWIRDYLFIPLGGSRCSKARTIFNLTAVMAICGLWHGANWNFVVWGLWHGLGLALLRVYRPIGARVPDTRAVRWLGTVATFHFVCIGWVLFASPDLPTALISLRRML